MPLEAGAVVLMILLLCQAQDPVGPSIPRRGFALGVEFAAIPRPG